MIDHKDITPGYWYARDSDKPNDVPFIVEVDERSRVWYTASEIESSISQFEFVAPVPAPITVDVQVMRKSKGTDYFVRIKCGERSVTPHVFTDRFKAEYEAAYYQWVFGLRA